MASRSQSELERLVQEQSRALQAERAARRRSEQMLAEERESAERLQHVATQLINVQGVEVLYEQILDATLAILRADFASIQMFHPERGSSGELRLLGHRGFSAEAAKRWEWVGPTTLTTCGEALRTSRKVAVQDIKNCDFMAGCQRFFDEDAPNIPGSSRDKDFHKSFIINPQPAEVT